MKMKHACSKCDHKMPKGKKKPMKTPKGEKAEKKVTKVMKEWKHGKLHSGSKKGPVVKNRRQAVAIALSESRKAKK